MRSEIWKSVAGKGAWLAILLFFGGLCFFLKYGLPFVIPASEAAWISGGLFFFGLYLSAQFLAAAIDLLRGTYKATLVNFLHLWRSYLFLTLIHLLMWVMAIPLFLFLFIAGPVVFLGGLIALGLLFIYLLQTVLGFDLVARPPDGREAIWSTLFLLAGGLLIFLLSRLMKHNYDPMDRLADFYVRSILQPAQERNERWLEGMDR
ncbi:MAG: hypothetical protein R2824_19525 [Saprospiraceae bacterium]|nr:hypothetical protein [Lewinella sp.]